MAERTVSATLPLARDLVPTPRIVAIGGGTGLPVVLRGLCRVCGNIDLDRRLDWLTAIVTVMDSGGSS
jgi:2-phospho-L-lactate transferase/gluconeogenesis factor (CofD/UPF0052 family)